MAFRKCGKCKYAFVPQEYANCPKCGSSMAAAKAMRIITLVAGAALVLGAGIYVASAVLPRVHITIQ